MLSRMPWFERKFAFTFPVELYPNVMARLRGTPARIEEMLQAQPLTLLTASPEKGWSALEHAGHLVDLEPLWLARVHDYVERKAELTATDLANRKTDEAKHNASRPSDIALQFRARRGRLMLLVDGLDPSLLVRTIPHPRLKTPMRLVDHLYFVAEHDDHHLARIWELLKS